MNILTTKQTDQLVRNDPELTDLFIRYHHLDDLREFVQKFVQSGNTHVTTLGFDDSDLTDELLSVLSGLKNTSILRLCLSDMNTQITDTGIAHLASFSSLQQLEIAGFLTKAGLGDLLKGLPQLQILEILSAELTEEECQPFLVGPHQSLHIILNGVEVSPALMEPPSSGQHSPRIFSETSSPHSTNMNQSLLKELLQLLLDASAEKHFDELAKRLDSRLLKNFVQSSQEAIQKSQKARSSPHRAG